MSAAFDRVEILLCDADGNLFPSEEPAFEASTQVTNRVLRELGIDLEFTPDELRAAAVGKNFRATVTDLAAEHGVEIDPEKLERDVAEEKRAVSAHLGDVLRPDPAVLEPLTALAARFRLAAVSSSALSRLDACFEATGLAGLFPASERYSAEDSLPEPTSKPDPAIYRLAGERLGVAGAQAVAIEDAVAGVRSAVGAGFPTVGNVLFVAEDERAERISDLRDAGAEAIVTSWWELDELLNAARAAA
jgi:beta-phosphoglucomutase-like phosphatase (HAD superfamily)